MEWRDDTWKSNPYSISLRCSIAITDVVYFKFFHYHDWSPIYTSLTIFAAIFAAIFAELQCFRSVELEDLPVLNRPHLGRTR